MWAAPSDSSTEKTANDREGGGFTFVCLLSLSLASTSVFSHDIPSLILDPASPGFQWTLMTSRSPATPRPLVLGWDFKASQPHGLNLYQIITLSSVAQPVLDQHTQEEVSAGHFLASFSCLNPLNPRAPVLSHHRIPQRDLEADTSIQYLLLSQSWTRTHTESWTTTNRKKRGREHTCTYWKKKREIWH